MNKININALIQILGMAGVIGSLIFVGLEMQQSHRIALSSQQQARTEIFTEIVNSYNESSATSLYGVLSKLQNNQSLSEEEKKMSENYAFQLLWIFENDYIQYQNNLIDENVWEAKLHSIRTVYSYCENRDALNYLLEFMNSKLSDLLNVSSNAQCI